MADENSMIGLGIGVGFMLYCLIIVSIYLIFPSVRGWIGYMLDKNNVDRRMGEIDEKYPLHEAKRDRDIRTAREKAILSAKVKPHIIPFYQSKKIKEEKKANGKTTKSTRQKSEETGGLTIRIPRWFRRKAGDSGEKGTSRTEDRRNVQVEQQRIFPIQPSDNNGELADSIGTGERELSESGTSSGVSAKPRRGKPRQRIFPRVDDGQK